MPHGKQFMKLTTQKLLFDAFSACNLIEEFVARHDFNSYLVEILPDLPRIVGLRNRLIHGYATMNNQVIWSIVMDDIPILAKQLAELV